MTLLKSYGDHWDRRFLGLCNELASWSSCLSRQTGAILVRDKRIISTGYNGPPMNHLHCGDLEPFEDKCPRVLKGFKSREGLNLCPALHAEQNCIINAAIIGVPTLDTIMYMSCGVPCKDCIKMIINSGIKGLVCTSLKFYDDLSISLLKNSNLAIRSYGN